MTNTAIIIIAFVLLGILAARKWDTLKWLLALGFIILALYTAFSMGMMDKYIPDIKTPTVDFK